MFGSKRREKFANLVVAFQGMPKRQLRVELVAVAPPIASTREIAVCDEFCDDALAGTFGNAHGFGDIPQPHTGIFGNTQQNMRVISEKGPVGHLPSIEDIRYAIHAILSTCHSICPTEGWRRLFASVLLAVAVINAAIGYAQERRAEGALDCIRKMHSLHAHSRREEVWVDVNAEARVPVDVTRLMSGDKVSIDVCLTGSINSREKEAALTGLPVPAEKTIHPGSPMPGSATGTRLELRCLDPDTPVRLLLHPAHEPRIPTQPLSVCTSEATLGL